MHTVTEDRQVG